VKWDTFYSARKQWLKERRWAGKDTSL